MARWYFLACFIPSFSLVAGQSTRYELSGQKVSLKSDIPGTPDNILWKRNGNKVVEFNGQEQEVYGQYENRISLNWHTAELEITDLRIEDSGEYELEVYMNEKFSTSLHKLEVVDRVAKPTISCEMNNGGISNKSGMLLCSAEPRQPQSLMRFEWRSNENVQPGTKLTISLGDEYDDKVYSCRVSNPLSEETATFTAKDCYPENDSVLTAVLVSVAVISLLLMGLVIICCKQHNKACFAKRNKHDPEKPGATKESDENTADECQSLFNRTSPSSSQRLIQEQEGDLQDEIPQKGNVQNKIKLFEPSFRGKTLPITFPAGSKRNKERPPLDLNHHANNNKGDADEDQLRESTDTEVPQCENTPEPVVVLTNTISSSVAEQSESDKETAEDDEMGPPLETTPTPPTPQPRNHVGDTVKDLEEYKDENEETGSPPSTPRRESHSPLDPSKVLPHRDSSDSEKENEPELADVSTNMMSDLETSTASVHQDLEKAEDGKSPLENVVTPVPKPRSQFNGGQKEDANSDQVKGETDTSGVGETNESGASSEDEQLSPVSEQKDSETTRYDIEPNLTQSETHSSEDNQQEINKPVPVADQESGSEDNSEEPDLYSASSRQPQNSTPTKPDNRTNDTFQESPDAAHEEAVQRGDGKTMKGSNESDEREDDTGEDKK